MPNPQPQLERMKEAALKAQGIIPAPWGYDLNGYIAHIPPDDEEWGATVCKLVGQPWKHDLGEHIAACTPQAVLALITEVERLGRVVDAAVEWRRVGYERKDEFAYRIGPLLDAIDTYDVGHPRPATEYTGADD